MGDGKRKDDGEKVMKAYSKLVAMKKAQKKDSETGSVKSK
jgi:hypothetical protein